jgi:spore coat polysaccharide biosynthesis protein SpsF (cytidylyltransferase family)
MSSTRFLHRKKKGVSAMNSKVAAVIVARMGSSRLPGKSLAEISGRPLIEVVIDRLKRFDLFDSIILATSTLSLDDNLASVAAKAGALTFRGDPEDVLSRLSGAADMAGAEIIVEVGGDCPFIDPVITKQAIQMIKQKNLEYVSNVDPTTFPDGLDIHAVKRSALSKANREAILTSERHHPFGYFHRKSSIFAIENIESETDLSHIRLTLDYAEDLELLRNVYEKLFPQNPVFGLQEILSLFSREPELLQINQKWATPAAAAKGAVPAYWLNSSYWKDSLRDLANLVQKAGECENNKDYARSKEAFALIADIASELARRADYFETQNRN